MSSRGIIGILFGFLTAFGACGDEGAPCDLSGKCLPSYVCQAGQCVLGSDSKLSANCGPSGCELEAVGGAFLRIPPLAMTETRQITMNVASSGLSGTQLNRVSKVYALEPLGYLLQVPARFEFTITSSLGVDAKDLRVYWAENPGDPWEILTGSSKDMVAVGELDRLGLVFVGRP